MTTRRPNTSTILANAARWDRLGKPFAADKARAIAAKLGTLDEAAGCQTRPTGPLVAASPRGGQETGATLSQVERAASASAVPTVPPPTGGALEQLSIEGA